MLSFSSYLDSDQWSWTSDLISSESSPSECPLSASTESTTQAAANTMPALPDGAPVHAQQQRDYCYCTIVNGARIAVSWEDFSRHVPVKKVSNDSALFETVKKLAGSTLGTTESAYTEMQVGQLAEQTSAAIAASTSQAETKDEAHEGHEKSRRANLAWQLRGDTINTATDVDLKYKPDVVSYEQEHFKSFAKDKKQNPRIDIRCIASVIEHTITKDKYATEFSQSLRGVWFQFLKQPLLAKTIHMFVLRKDFHILYVDHSVTYVTEALDLGTDDGLQAFLSCMVWLHDNYANSQSPRNMTTIEGAGEAKLSFSFERLTERTKITDDWIITVGDEKFVTIKPELRRYGLHSDFSFVWELKRLNSPDEKCTHILKSLWEPQQLVPLPSNCASARPSAIKSELAVHELHKHTQILSAMGFVHMATGPEVASVNKTIGEAISFKDILDDEDPSAKKTVKAPQQSQRPVSKIWAIFQALQGPPADPSYLSEKPSSIQELPRGIKGVGVGALSQGFPTYPSVPRTQIFLIQKYRRTFQQMLTDYAQLPEVKNNDSLLLEKIARMNLGALTCLLEISTRLEMIHGDYSWSNIFEAPGHPAWKLETVMGDWGQWNPAQPRASQLYSYSGTGPWVSPSVLCRLVHLKSLPLQRTIVHECDSNFLGLVCGLASFAKLHGGDGKEWCRGREAQSWDAFFREKHYLIMKPRTSETFRHGLPNFQNITKAQAETVEKFIAQLCIMQRILFGQFVDRLGPPLPDLAYYEDFDEMRAQKADETARRYFLALDEFCNPEFDGLRQLHACLQVDLNVCAHNNLVPSEKVLDWLKWTESEILSKVSKAPGENKGSGAPKASREITVASGEAEMPKIQD